MKRRQSLGRPPKSEPTTRVTVPTAVIEAHEKLMRSRGLTKDEAWAHVLEKLSSPSTSGDEDDGDAPRRRALGVQGKRGRAAEDEEDEEDDHLPEVSEQELSDPVDSIPAAQAVLEEMQHAGSEELGPLVDELREEIARLGRRLAPQRRGLLPDHDWMSQEAPVDKGKEVVEEGVFFEGDRRGPPSASFDDAPSGQHVARHL